MSSSREESPDWLRCFQAPTRSNISLSSDSNHSADAGPSRDDGMDSRSSKEGDDDDDTVISRILSRNNSNAKAQNKGQKEGITPSKKKKGGVALEESLAAKEVTPEKHKEANAAKPSIWTLSSDSESYPDNSSRRYEDEVSVKDEDDVSVKDEDAVVVPIKKVSPLKDASKEKSPKKRRKIENNMPKKEKDVIDNDNIQGKGAEDCIGEEVAEEDTSGKHNGPHALVECEGDSIDLSGDMGAVGRVVIPDAQSGSPEMYFDLKGTIYRTKIVPSRTFCIVSFGQSEAKIEAIMNDVIQLKPESNVYEAETMVEGTLEGFSFDSEDEADKIPKTTLHQNDQNEGAEEQINGKAKGKALKPPGAVKKGKSAGGKSRPVKTVRKKAQVSKKSRTKK
ncbi:hypothetical protein Tsubulata_000027 [Turnera subulata]|uniref:DNA-binding protein BIN4 n=1 Tax=Turnera subulata TaxID=218843 RepID=A0A9Q0J8N1_9ROSI|nr:hypothetical protein Tsubulata_000027 [Turnera subulata]